MPTRPARFGSAPRAARCGRPSIRWGFRTARTTDRTLRRSVPWPTCSIPNRARSVRRPAKWPRDRYTPAPPTPPRTRSPGSAHAWDVFPLILMMPQKTLRSTHWFGSQDRDGFIHRSWMRGYPRDLFDGRPVIGICNTWSELTPCNAHLRGIAEHVKRGVYEMGGFPVEFPVMSLGESNLRPTAMLFRNLASMDVEESIRANPMDGVILLVGCDKTTPACLMGSASCDLPTIAVSGGPMLRGTFRGANIGSGTDLWRFSEEVK